MTPVLARELAAPAVVRFRDLEQRYTTSRATEAGFRRWIVSYLGGPEGHVNPSRETGIVSDRVVVGAMGIPPGNRQHGFHVHGVAEIYVVVRGTLRSLGPGGDHLAGPLDCLYIPADAPHGVEAVGDEEAVFVWLHDRLERDGRAVYYDSLDDAPPGDAATRLIPWTSLPDDGGGGRVWLAGELELGARELDASERTEPRAVDALDVVVGLAGEPALTYGGARVRLGELDAAIVPPGVEYALAAAEVPARVVVVRDRSR